MLQTEPEEFEANTRELLQRRLASPEFNRMLPLKVTHGSQYKSYESMHNAGGKYIRLDMTISL